MKVIILTMLSSGVRTGGLADIRLKDLYYIEEYKLYRIIVYSDSPGHTYYTFCTPECASFIKLYLEYRKNNGEELNPESPLIRQKFDCVNDIKMTSEDIQERVRNLLMNTGFTKKRDKSPNRKRLTYEELVESRRKRNEVMRCHGFRKYFNTICIESGKMNIISKELLMGHKKNLGLDIHYYRPTSDKLLNEYLKVVIDLTIDESNRLSKQVQELMEKNEDKDYVIKGKLQEKDEQIKQLIAKQEKFELLIQSLIDNKHLNPKLG
jgi:integrase